MTKSQNSLNTCLEFFWSVKSLRLLSVTTSLLIWHLTRNEDSRLAFKTTEWGDKTTKNSLLSITRTIRQVSGSISRTLNTIKVHLLKVEENIMPAAEWYTVQVTRHQGNLHARQPVVPLQAVDWRIEKTTKGKLAEVGTEERLFWLVSVVKSGVIAPAPSISFNRGAPQAHEARERSPKPKRSIHPRNFGNHVTARPHHRHTNVK